MQKKIASLKIFTSSCLTKKQKIDNQTNRHYLLIKRYSLSENRIKENPEKIFRKHGGILRMKDALAHGITRYMLYALREN